MKETYTEKDMRESHRLGFDEGKRQGKKKVNDVIENLNQKIQSHIDLFDDNNKKLPFEEGVIAMAKDSQSYIRQSKKELKLK